MTDPIENERTTDDAQLSRRRARDEFIRANAGEPGFLDQNERLDAISATAELVDGAVEVVDHRMRIAWVNKDFETLFGYDSSDVVGMPVHALQPGHDAEVWDAMLDAMTEGKSWSGEFCRLQPDGTEVVVAARLTTAVDELGRLRFAVINSISASEANDVQVASLQRIAYHDTLTGIRNRRAFERDINVVLGTEIPNDMALVYFDLNSFKLINDRFGHAAGDAVLEAVASRALSELTPNEEIYRMGGDEFAIILRNTPSHPAVRQRVRALAAAVRASLLLPRGVRVKPEISAGAMRLDGWSGTLDELLSTVDASMYASKRGQRVLTIADRDALPEDTNLDELVIARMRSVLMNNAMEFRFSPISDAALGNVVGYDAKLHWERTPGAPIPMEEHTLDNVMSIGELDAIIYFKIERIAQIMHFALTYYDSKLRMHLNLTPTELSRYNVVGHLERVCEKLSIPHALVAIDVSRPHVLHREIRATEMAEALEKAGFPVYIDELGVEPIPSYKILQLRPHGLKVDYAAWPEEAEARASRMYAMAVHKLGDMAGSEVIGIVPSNASATDIARGLFGKFIERRSELITAATLLDRISNAGS